MSASIKIDVNGKVHRVPAPSNVRQLLEYLGVGTDRIAVELNRSILRRKDWDRTTLDDKDKIEIVQFVGGG